MTFQKIQLPRNYYSYVSSDPKIHTVGIKCRSCDTRWKIQITLTKNQIESFATICECGAIIVGNYNKSIGNLEDGKIEVKNKNIAHNKRYLSNGQFDFLQLDNEQLDNLPLLDLE